MPTKKVIPNIVPWNDLYFKNCYYSALFPVIQYYRKSITPIVLNDVFIYKTGDDSTYGFIELEKPSIKDTDEILKNMGIIPEVKSPTDIIGELKKSIDKGLPVLLFIDCFYETLRFDSFNRHHWGHIVLTYGYDDEMQAFDILEHKYGTGFTYDCFKFSYEDVVKCYEGFLKNVRNGDFTGYIEYRLDLELKEREYTEADEQNNILTFINTMISKKSSIFEGIEILERFAERFADSFGNLVLNTEILSNKKIMENINHRLNFIRISKTVERYRLHKVFGDGNNASVYANELLEHWGYIAGIFGKFDCLAAMPKPYFDSIVEKLKRIPEIEYNYYKKLFRVFDEWRMKNR